MLLVRRSCRVQLVSLSLAAVFTVSFLSAPSRAIAQDKPEEKAASAPATTAHASAPSDSVTEGSVTVGGQAIAYRAVAGTITVGGSDPQDATIGFDGKPLPDANVKLPMPKSLQSNISYHYYEAGHMIYVKDDVLKQFHADVSSFIKATESGK